MILFSESNPIGNLFLRMAGKIMECPIRKYLNDPLKMLEAAGVKPNMKILEIGCGTGYFTIPAAQLIGNDTRLNTIDRLQISVDAVKKRLKKSKITNVIVEHSDATKMHFKNDCFDLVFVFGIIPAPSSVLPLKPFLQEIHRVLLPKGNLAVWTINPIGLKKSIKQSGFFDFHSKNKGIYIFSNIC